MRALCVIAIVLTIAVVIPATGQTLTIKLDQDRKTQQVIPEGTYTIEVVNQLPGADYERSVDIHEQTIPAIDLAAAVPKASEKAEKSDLKRVLESFRLTTCSTPADEDKALAKTLKAATTEKEVAAALASAKAVCLPETAAVVAATRYKFDQLATVKRGQELVVTITRGKESWIATYTTAGRGSFRTSYGFSFLPNHDKEYFTLELGAADNIVNDQKFEIRRKRSNSRSADFVPTVNFSWYPSWRPKDSWSIGPTVALGFDFSNPVVMAGLSATYNQNFTISFGAAAQKQKRLVGQYSEGQRVKENLDSTTLTTQTYGANFFISLSIRSLANPFSK